MEHRENEIARIAVDAMVEVHRELGPGLLESSYQYCLAHELRQRGLVVDTEVALPLIFKGVKLDAGYRIDIWIVRTVIVEVKSVDALHPIHTAQMLTYLKLTGCRLGLLVNFNEKLVRNGIRRLVNNLPEYFRT